MADQEGSHSGSIRFGNIRSSCRDLQCTGIAGNVHSLCRVFGGLLRQSVVQVSGARNDFRKQENRDGRRWFLGDADKVEQVYYGEFDLEYKSIKEKPFHEQVSDCLEDMELIYETK